MKLITEVSCHPTRKHYAHGLCESCYVLRAKPANKARKASYVGYVADRYGLAPEAYQAMSDAQGGVCAICKDAGTFIAPKRLVVDHCHDTGKVRALLCYLCNTNLGRYQDDPAKLRRAAEYLESFLSKAA